jgi:hypothetical protein
MGGFETLVHLPSCWVEEWVEIRPHPAELAFLASPIPIPIGVYADTPQALLELTGAFAHIRQLEIVGHALLATLEALKPRFHRSWINGKLLLAAGTTIIVTGYEGRHVIFGTWDAGEDVAYAMSRLAEMRRVCKLHSSLANALLAPASRELPAPQAILSNVIPYGIPEPPMPLGGYEAAHTPIGIAVGTKRITITVDHRLLNPPDEIVLLEELKKRLNYQLQLC